MPVQLQALIFIGLSLLFAVIGFLYVQSFACKALLNLSARSRAPPVLI